MENQEEEMRCLKEKERMMRMTRAPLHLRVALGTTHCRIGLKMRNAYEVSVCIKVHVAGNHLRKTPTMTTTTLPKTRLLGGKSISGVNE